MTQHLGTELYKEIARIVFKYRFLKMSQRSFLADRPATHCDLSVWLSVCLSVTKRIQLWLSDTSYSKCWSAWTS